MSLQHHAAAAEEGEGAAKGALGLWEDASKERGWGDRCAPSPFPQPAVTVVASGLSPRFCRFSAGAKRVR